MTTTFISRLTVLKWFGWSCKIRFGLDDKSWFGLDDKRHRSQDHFGSPWSLFSSAGGPPLWPACSWSSLWICTTLRWQTCAIRSLILCSRSSILDPMSSILEIIWSDMVWNLRHRMKSRKILVVPTCLASAGACSGCSWSARPHSLDPAGQPLPCSPPLFHPYPLPHCLTF